MPNKITLLFSLLVLVGFGCGKNTTDQTKDGELKIEQKGNQAKFEVTTKEGTAKVAASDSSVPLPDNFPKDVPIFKDATVKFTSTQGEAMVVHMTVSATIAEGAKFYQEKLLEQGWEIEANMNMGEANVTSAKKENRKCSVNVFKNDQTTMIQIVVTQEKP